jgi:hypothetical protein
VTANSSHGGAYRPVDAREATERALWEHLETANGTADPRNAPPPRLPKRGDSSATRPALAPRASEPRPATVAHGPMSSQQPQPRGTAVSSGRRSAWLAPRPRRIGWQAAVRNRGSRRDRASQGSQRRPLQGARSVTHQTPHPAPVRVAQKRTTTHPPGSPTIHLRPQRRTVSRRAVSRRSPAGCRSGGGGTCAPRSSGTPWSDQRSPASPGRSR